VFCVCIENNLGIGKIINTDGSFLLVEYFLSPTLNPLVEKLHKKDVKRKVLSKQTRVYWFDKVYSKWKVGRVIEDDRENYIFVRFPDNVEEKITYDEIYVRCNNIISDPTPYLANRINETPFFAVHRQGFVRSFIKQRNACAGMAGLLSASIDLEKHQVEVVHKVLRDPVQRYLLADEVGLGKTIEAGAIIRQHLFDNQYNCKVVILTPVALVTQWEEELTNRFHLEVYFDDIVNIASYETKDPFDLEDIEYLLSECSLLVIDEAHIFVNGISCKSQNKMYSIVQNYVTKISSLLLLSATPALGNESSFLAMLNLLDPAIYPLDSLEDFKLRIEKRVAIAQIIAQLIPENVDFLDDTIDELKNMFPQDSALIKLSDDLEKIIYSLPSCEDESLINAIDTLRNHITDTYKLHRRIIRNRRKNVHGITPDRVGVTSIYYDDVELEHLIMDFDDWRINQLLNCSMRDGQVEDIIDNFKEMLTVLFQDLYVFSQLIKRKMKNISTLKDGEYALLEKIYFSSELVLKNNTKLKVVTDVIEQNIKAKRKVVIFCSDPNQADKLYEDMFNIFRENLVRHSEHKEEWSQFLSSEACNILICDYTAESGINLQGGHKVIIHYDIPLSPNRLEQRIGRLDRYGISKDILNYTLIAKQNSYEIAWENCLKNGFKIFDQSIASLQYFIEEHIDKLYGSILENGQIAIENFTAEIIGADGTKGLVQSELERIEQYELLDESNSENIIIDKMDDIDIEEDEIVRDAEGLIVNSLLFKKNSLDNKIFNYQYLKNYDYNYGQETLIPLDDYINDFTESIDYENRNSSAKRPLTYPYTFCRNSAVHQFIRLIRYGNEFLNSVWRYLEKDDRGRSYAVWRYVPKSLMNFDNTKVVFEFNFLVEVDITPVKQINNSSETISQISLSNTKRLGDSFYMPEFKTLWVDSYKSHLDTNLISECLALKYSKKTRENGSFDKNINPLRWSFIENLGIEQLEYWSDLCQDISKYAVEVLKSSASFSEKITSAVNDFRNINYAYFSQIESRLKSFSSETNEIERDQFEYEKIIYERLLEGIKEPSVTIDSIGVVFLSNEIIEI